MNWVFLAILAPFAWALSNVVDKFLLDKKVKSCFALAPVSGFVCLIAGIVISFLFFDGWSESLIYAFLLGFVGCVLFFLYYYAMSLEEASRVISMWYVTPVLVLVLSALFLGERLPVWKYPAIFAISFGAIFLGFRKFEGKFLLRSAFYWLMLNCAISAILQVSQKFLLGSLSFWQLFGASQISLGISLIASLFFPSVRSHFSHVVKSVHIIAFSQGLALFGYVVFLAAMSKADVSLVSALGSVQPLYVLFMMVCLSVFLPSVLKEEISRKILLIKFFSIALVVAGAFVISL